MSSSNNPRVTAKPIVWICHDKGGFDFTKAEVHGEVRSVFKGDFNPFDLHAAMRIAEEILKDSHANDWVIPIGNGVAQMVVALAFVAKHDRLPLLVFHAQRCEYVKREHSNFHPTHK